MECSKNTIKITGDGSEARFRQPDIVKPRRGDPSSSDAGPSPQRSLLHGGGAGSPSASAGGGYTSDLRSPSAVVDLGDTSPPPTQGGGGAGAGGGPPRNIFDDL